VGPPGPDGKSAFQVWVDDGNTGTIIDFFDDLKGESGQDGLDGKSAYQVWLDVGNTGTEADFLTSLEGTQGPQGPPGTPGTPTYSIGDSYGGGIVFYVYDGGLHGLIAAASDQSVGVYWSVGSTVNRKTRAKGGSSGYVNFRLEVVRSQRPIYCSYTAAEQGTAPYLNIYYPVIICYGGMQFNVHFSTGWRFLQNADLQSNYGICHQFIICIPNNSLVTEFCRCLPINIRISKNKNRDNNNPKRSFFHVNQFLMILNDFTSLLPVKTFK